MTQPHGVRRFTAERCPPAVAWAAMAAGGDSLPLDHHQLGERLTIAGGTSEIQRNVIAERLLGLLRDPV